MFGHIAVKCGLSNDYGRLTPLSTIFKYYCWKLENMEKTQNFHRSQTNQQESNRPILELIGGDNI